MSSTIHPRSSIITRQRVAHEVVWMPVTWALYVGAVALVTGLVATFGTISSSAWDSASQLPRWYIGAVGVYLTAVHLPLYVAHGFSRREFMGQVPIFTLASVTALSILMTLGYAAERFVYGALGWPQVLGNAHLFASPAEYHLVFSEFWLLYLMWMAVGALVGAGFYRSAMLGLPTAVIGLLGLGWAEAAMGLDIMGPLPFAYPVLSELPLVQAAAVSLSIACVALAFTWLVVRDVPVRNRKS